jgi:hypothetical protein
LDFSSKYRYRFSSEFLNEFNSKIQKKILAILISMDQEQNLGGNDSKIGYLLKR